MITKIEKVGFIGLGRMGLPIARNIQKAGFSLIVYNRSPQKAQLLLEAGATRAASPEELARLSDVVITCLMDDKSMLDIVSCSDGLLAGMRPGSIHIGTATISPATASNLAKLHQAIGCYYLAAPLFGRPDAAESGTLLSYVAGDEQAVQVCDDLFKAYTRSHIYMGTDQKVVNSIKLTMNFMLVALIELFSEVYTFAEKSGIEAEFTEGLIQTVLAHPVMKEYTRRIRERDFSPIFELKAGFKDVELMLQASGEVRAPLNIASLAREKFLTALGSGMGNQDWSSVSMITRKNANLE